MKLGIISDTHNLLRPEVYAIFSGVDLILHAGDVCGLAVIAELEAIAPVKAVRGNNDWELPARFKEVLTFDLGKRAIRIQHIFHGIPEGDIPTHAVAKIVIFGHQHKPCNRYVGDTLYFNPGSAGPRRFDYPVTAGIIRLDKQTVESEIVHLV